MRKLNSGDKLYVCDRKRCGDRCHYPDCRHTTDISHAINAPTFPNGFEKVEHNGNVYFVEREDSKWSPHRHPSPIRAWHGDRRLGTGKRLHQPCDPAYF